MSLSLEMFPFIKQIASAPEKWKINVNAELKTFILKTGSIDHLHSFIVTLLCYVKLIFKQQNENSIVPSFNICILKLLGPFKN